jgi:hypothetical protein
VGERGTLEHDRMNLPRGQSIEDVLDLTDANELPGGRGTRPLLQLAADVEWPVVAAGVTRQVSVNQR